MADVWGAFAALPNAAAGCEGCKRRRARLADLGRAMPGGRGLAGAALAGAGLLVVLAGVIRHV